MEIEMPEALAKVVERVAFELGLQEVHVTGTKWELTEAYR